MSILERFGAGILSARGSEVGRAEVEAGAGAEVAVRVEVEAMGSVGERPFHSMLRRMSLTADPERSFAIT